MAVLENGVWNAEKQAAQLIKQDSFSQQILAENNRYHLYISLACPFAHRPYLVINYLGLDQAISVSTLAPKRFDNGWLFDGNYPDPIAKQTRLIDVYLSANSSYTGSVSVPVLWDKRKNTISENSSLAIAEHLATDWLSLANNPIELMPASRRRDIRELNTWLHQNVNRKVYHLGFANNQYDYNQASDEFFSALEFLDQKLENSQYLLGSDVLLSDLVLLPTLVRMEAIYETHFKANQKSLKAFKNLYRYMLDLVSIDAIRNTIDIDHMKAHYFFSHKHINPSGIIPLGPDIDW